MEIRVIYIGYHRDEIGQMKCLAPKEHQGDFEARYIYLSFKQGDLGPVTIIAITVQFHHEHQLNSLVVGN